MALSPGDHVDRYEVLSLLGSGGMGEVYRAKDPKLEREVALKIVRVDGAWGSEGSARLVREARAIAALSHPNVLAVFDVGEVSEPERLRGLAYIAMELVEGRSLRSFIGDPTLTLERRVAILRAIARGLAAAHDVGLIHRDVKPENVMVRNDGGVKVLDFGIARRALPAPPLRSSSTSGQSISGPPEARDSAMTAPHVAVGTPFYMAPEQLRAEALDGRADQFAWGVVAYELLTGAAPWTGDQPFVVISQILSKTPVPPASVDPRIGDRISSAILRTLSKERADRFATMHELLLSLGESGSVELAPQSAVSPLARSHTMPSLSPAAAPAKRRRRPLSMGLGLVVAVAAGLFVVKSFVGGPKGSGPDARAPEAAAPLSNAACSLAHGGAPWRFRAADRACIELASPDCKVFAAPSDLKRDDTVWIGGLFPMTGREAADYVSELNVFDLARKDFADTLVGSVAREGGGHTRPIAIVACDEAADPLRAAHHLADDVEVPAVVGFRWSKTALEAIPSVFLPRHVLSLISLSQSAGLTKIPQPAGEPRLVFRSTLDADATAAPVSALITEVLEPRVRAQGLGARPMRIALVHLRTGRGSVAEELLRELRFNGKSALDNGDDLRRFVFDEGTDGGADPAVDAVVDFAPQIIVFWGSSFASRVLAPLEQRWARGPRPLYVTMADFSDATAAFAGSDPTRRSRFFGMANSTLTMTNAQLVLHYNQAHPEAPVTRTSAPQPSYDAFYLLAYATEALGDAPVTGPALSTALLRLTPPGTPIDVGPSGIFDAFETLRSGGRIDLKGAIGSLDFDPATGQAPIDYSILCLGLSDRGVAQGAVESGLVYEAGGKKLVGKLHCP